MNLPPLKHHPFSEANLGNGILEFLLYTPILLMLIFGVTDAGFVYTEKAALVDSLRSGLNSAAHYSRANPFLSMDPTSTLVVDQPNANLVVNNIADLVFLNLQNTLSLLPNRDKSNYTIHIALLKLEPDLNTLDVFEKFSSSSLISVATRSSSNPAFNIKNAIPAFSYQAMDDFINSRIKKDKALFLSSLAPHSSVSGHVDFAAPKNSTFLLYGEISAIASGISQNYAKSALGKYYGLQEQLLVPVRSTIK